MNTEQNNPKNNGLDNWNDRLDHNLEPEKENDMEADDNARKYSENIDDSDHSKEQPTPSTPRGPKDGLDNTGTQGYDSLTDDSYTGSSKKNHDKTNESGTGSSTSDFDDPKQMKS